jgi:RHS repeat-associated protein
VGTTTVTLPSTALIGLYVNSVNSGTLGTATFDNVSITPVTSPPSTATDYYGYTASGDTPDFLTDSSNNITEKYLTLPGDVLVTIRPSKTTPADKTYSLPDIHGDIFATTNATGTLLTTGQTGPFGEQLSGQTTPTNTATNATFGYVGQHEKITEASFTLTPVQMGARVYIPGLGRFLSVDPQQGGTANAYVYALDPVNDFDLDGTFSLKNALSVATKIATVGSFIPGPVGMACSGVAAAGYIAQGQYANAAMAAVAFIPGGKIASSLASKSSFGTKMLTAVVRTQSKAPGIGVKGGLFGTKALSAKSGLLNRNNPVLKIGWHRDSGKTVFRLGVGQKTYYNFNRAKNVKVSRWHVNIGRF